MNAAVKEGRQRAWVVWQDKGNASVYRATTVLLHFLRSFSPRHGDAHASEYRVGRASPHRAALEAHSGPVRRLLLTLVAASAGGGRVGSRRTSLSPPNHVD